MANYESSASKSWSGPSLGSRGNAVVRHKKHRPARPRPSHLKDVDAFDHALAEAIVAVRYGGCQTHAGAPARACPRSQVLPIAPGLNGQEVTLEPFPGVTGCFE